MKKRDVMTFVVAVFLTAILSFLFIPSTWNELRNAPSYHYSLFLISLSVLIVFAVLWIISFIIISRLKINAWEKEEEIENEKALNEYLEPVTKLVSQEFIGKRTVIIEEWDDIDSNLEFNINYFLKKFENKIDIIDKRVYEKKVLITFKMK